MKLYSYWRSSAAYRTRIALNFKQLNYKIVPVNLAPDSNEQQTATYGEVNPARLVPALDDDGFIIHQSMAIIEYLDNKYPQQRLIPEDSQSAAQVRAIAQDIACDIHPLNNLRVLNYLQDKIGIDDKLKQSWYHHWLHTGFAAIERQLRHCAGHYAVANNFSLADVCLVPQVYNALRYKLDISPYSMIQRVYGHCLELEAVRKAKPEIQPDAVHSR
ncbi:maleylacetoacetate isomerase [Saccharobesus litoralis]|uniref:Maleylacetoacetate isomerase n=1 Tax=Saccharobesus litoralis TaxID=2172099 RepID=A0A2S0VXH4_9ALTE|nr:maleylacetoacetate isomerase [Saccharobesus litoralis]AWB68927.1 maleylacetoacetate isomerase [Saccharobesus litoralis]